MKDKNKKTTILKFSIVILLFTFYYFHSGLVRAQSLAYPIVELGNCRDNRECYLYCEIPEDKPACWSYGKYILPKVLGEQTKQMTTNGDEDLQDLDQEIAKLEQENIQDEGETQMQNKIRQYNIKFPIEELGNCVDYQQCRAYCEKSEHQQECSAFAKKKGFYQEYKDGDYSDLEKKFLQKAKEILGCSTKEECHQFCEQPTNHDRCEEFARKLSQEGVRTGYSPAVDKAKILEMAKADLDCVSHDACRQFCEKNTERCMEFAKRHGLYQENKQENKEEQSRRMEKARSLGCDNEESCRKFCSEHPTECPGYPTIQRLSPLPGHQYVKTSRYPQTTRYPQPTYYPHSTYYPQPTYIYSTGYPTYYQQPTSNSNDSYPTGYSYPPTTNSSYTSNTTY